MHSFLADTYAYREKLVSFLGKIAHSIPKEYIEDRNIIDEIKKVALDNFEPITVIRTKQVDPETGTP